VPSPSARRRLARPRVLPVDVVGARTGAALPTRLCASQVPLLAGETALDGLVHAGYASLGGVATASITDDGAGYWLADWEWFIPLDDAEEQFANRQRIRGGIGYRRNFNWRYELLYIWTRSRNTIDTGFSTNENSIDIRVKRVF